MNDIMQFDDKVSVSSNEPSNRDRVFNLTKDILELQAKKKDINRAFNDEIKRLKAEIKDNIEGKHQVLDVVDKMLVGSNVG